MEPKVTIIVPVYNVEDYLKTCVDSLINQTYRNLEIFLVDDGSSDSSGVICDEYATIDNRVSVIHKENAGPSSARNAALDLCTGEWVVFCDSDDQLETESVDALLKYAEKYNADIVRCGYIKHFEDNTEETISIDPPICLDNMEEILMTMDKTYYYSFAWSSLLKKSVIDENRFPEDLCFCEDHLFTLSCYRNAKRVAFIPECLYHYNIHSSGSLSSPKDFCGIVVQANREIDIKYQLLSNPKEEVITQIWKTYCSKINLALLSMLSYGRTYQSAKRLYNETKPTLRSPINCTFTKKVSFFYFSRLPFIVRFYILKYKV